MHITHLLKVEWSKYNQLILKLKTKIQFASFMHINYKSFINIKILYRLFSLSHVP